MGICDNQNNSYLYKNKIKKQSAILGINPINIDEIKDLFSYESAICKIKQVNLFNGIGFFCEFDDLPIKKALFTSYKVIASTNFSKIDCIEIDYLNKIKKIELNKTRKLFVNKEIGYFCIEIFDSDQIDQFFYVDETIYKNEKEIFILQYNNKGNLAHSLGIINDYENNVITYNTDTKILNSGLPLIQRDDINYILGIHINEIKQLEYYFENIAISFNIIMKDIKDKLNINKVNIKEIKFFEYRNIINLIYEKNDFYSYNRIFGSSFVYKNKNNIKLVINGKRSEFVEYYNLQKGINIIVLIIINKITNIANMFNDVIYLKNMEELKYLYTDDIVDCERMFYECGLLSNLKGLENFRVPKCKSFYEMFYNCKSLTDIKAIENWNVSNISSMCRMFYHCEKLEDINPLRNWDVSNVKNFGEMFRGCCSLIEIKALRKWNVSKGKEFYSLFSGCTSLLEIKPLKNWDVSNMTDIDGMFENCLNLSSLKGLENWDVSNVEDFARVFRICESIKDLKPLQNWDVSKADNFEEMFAGCILLTNLDGLDNWNVSNVKFMDGIFSYCTSLIDIKAIKNWNVSKFVYDPYIFQGCNKYLDYSPLSNWIYLQNSVY